MMVNKLPNDCLFVLLSENPGKNEDMQNLNLDADKIPDFDIILDFSRVEVLTSASISNLLTLRDYLLKGNRRLILCNVSFLNKCVFTVCCLQDVFEFSKDKATAVEALKLTNSYH